MLNTLQQVWQKPRMAANAYRNPRSCQSKGVICFLIFIAFILMVFCQICVQGIRNIAGN